MEITKTQTDELTTVTIKGRVDTNTAPELEKELVGLFESAPKLVLDLADVDYVSSAGLRVVLMAYKSLSARGKQLLITHVNDDVMEVFDMTGFSSFLEFED